jgi:hypothetical protein
LFDLQKSIRSLSRQAAGTHDNEEALDVKKGLRVELFDPCAADASSIQPPTC